MIQPQTRSRYPHLLQPFRLRHVTFKNRFMSTSHAPGYVEDRRIYAGGDALVPVQSRDEARADDAARRPARARPAAQIVVGAGPATPDPMSARAAIHRSSRVHGGKEP